MNAINYTLMIPLVNEVQIIEKTNKLILCLILN